MLQIFGSSHPSNSPTLTNLTVQPIPPNCSTPSRALQPDTSLGASRGTTFDTMDAHTFIPPVDLLFRRAQFRAATRICALLKHHPLYPLACKAASRLIRSHQSPLHYLFHLAGVKPQLIKTISPSSLRCATYQPVLTTTISVDKESAF